jgi:Spy/CpxP family protein refolding chaperone
MNATFIKTTVLPGLAAATLLLAAPAMAADNPDGADSGARRPPPRAGMALRSLDLSDEQRQKIRDIIESYQPQREALRQQAQALRNQMQGDIQAVLTPEQQAKLEEIRKRRQERAEAGRERGPRAGGRRFGPPPQSPDSP